MALIDMDELRPWRWQNRVQAQRQTTSKVAEIAASIRPMVERRDFDGARAALAQSIPQPRTTQNPLNKRVGETIRRAFEERKQGATGLRAAGTAQDDDGGFRNALQGGVRSAFRTVGSEVARGARANVGNLKAADEAITDAGYSAAKYSPLNRVFGTKPPAEQEIEGSSRGERMVGGLKRAGDIGMSQVSGERFVNNLAGRDVTSGLPTPVRYGIESFAAPITLATAGSAGFAGGGAKAVGQAIAKRWAMEGTADLAGRVTAEQVNKRLPEDTPTPVRIGASLAAGIAGGAATYKGLQAAPDLARGLKTGVDAQGGLVSELGEARIPGSGADDAARAAGDVLPDADLPFMGETMPGPSGRTFDVPDVGTSGIDEMLAAKTAVDLGPGNLASRWGPLKKAQSWLSPAVGMDRQVLIPYRASHAVAAQLDTRFRTAMRPAVDRLQAALRDNPVAYLGPAKESDALMRLRGTLPDIMENPQLYDISPALRAAIDDYAATQWAQVTSVARAKYGVDVLPYTGDDGFVYVPHMTSRDVSDDAIKQAVQAMSRGRGTKERAYRTIRDRVTRHPEWQPELDITELTERHLHGMALNAADTTFKRGTGGLTKGEVMEITHPGLKAARDDAAGRVASLRARINTAVRQAGGLTDEIDELDRTLAQFDRGMPEEGMRPLSRSGTVLRNAEGKVDTLRSDKNVRRMTGAGPVRLDVPPTDDALMQADAMERVTKPFREVIPDDVDQVAKLDTAMRRTRRRIDLLAERKDVRINNLGRLQKEMRDAEDALDKLRQMYRTAAIPEDQFVPSKATRLYHPPEIAKTIDNLRENPNSGLQKLFDVVDEIRAAHLAGDASPLTIQGQLAGLSDPVNLGAAIRWLGVDRSDPRDILRRIAANEADDVAEYTAATMRPFGTQSLELSVTQGKRGLGRIPAIRNLEDRMFATVEIGKFRTWQRDRDLLLKMHPERDSTWAANEAARLSERMIPSLSGAERGVSPTRQGFERVALTSTSFAASPALLLKDAASAVAHFTKAAATTGDLNVALRAVPGRELLAFKRMALYAGMTSTIAAASAAASAESRNMSPVEAMRRAVFDPTSGDWMTLQLGEGRRIGLGGPMRGFMRAILPNKDGVPFHGLQDWAMNKVNQPARLALDLAANEDWRGNPIRTGDTGIERFLQALYYSGESIAPISLGEAMSQVRTGTASVGSLISGVGSQLAGTNYTPPSPSERLSQISRERYGKEWFDLAPSEKKAIRESNPSLWTQYVAAASDRTQAAEREKAKFLDDQSGDDADLLAGNLALDKWAASLDDRRNQLVGAERVIYADLEKGGKRNPVLDGYYAAIDANTTNGRVDWAAVDTYVAGLPTADQRYIADNTGLTQTPLTALRKKLSSQYYELPRYRGYSADEAREIDELYNDARNIAGPRASDDRMMLRALRAAADGGRYSNKVVQAAAKRIAGDLQQTEHRERWLKAHPEGVLLTGRGRLSRPQLDAIQAALRR